MTTRHLPVRPDAEQLRHEATQILTSIHAVEGSDRHDLRAFHPKKRYPDEVQLAHGQLILARSYQAPSWTRLMVACSLIDAIWEDDVDTVREQVPAQP